LISGLEDVMPFVSVRMLEGRTQEQKVALAKAITQALIDCANAKLESCEVVIEDVPRASWMTAGKMMSDV
jgi:4-oxalocrotonate tautomerase